MNFLFLIRQMVENVALSCCSSVRGRALKSKTFLKCSCKTMDQGWIFISDLFITFTSRPFDFIVFLSRTRFKNVLFLISDGEYFESYLLIIGSKTSDLSTYRMRFKYFFFKNLKRVVLLLVAFKILETRVYDARFINIIIDTFY